MAEVLAFFSELQLVAARGPLALAPRPVIFKDNAARLSFEDSIFQIESFGDYERGKVFEYRYIGATLGFLRQWLISDVAGGLVHKARRILVALIELPIETDFEDKVYSAHAQLLFRVPARGGAQAYFVLYEPHARAMAEDRVFYLYPPAIRTFASTLARGNKGLYYLRGKASGAGGMCRNLCLKFLASVADDPSILDISAAGMVQLRP